MVAGAVLMPRLARALSPTARLTWAGAVFGAGMLALAGARSPAPAAISLLPVGAAWIVVIAGLNAAVQSFLPPWVRARALSVYQVVFFSATAVSAAARGLIADHLGLSRAFVLAGALLVAGAFSGRWWSLREVAAASRQPVDFWPDPAEGAAAGQGGELSAPVPPGAVLVQVRYEVPEQALEEFVRVAARVERSRRRTGASRWNLYRSLEEPGSLVEQFTVADRADHLAQHHERLTSADQSAQERLRSLATQVHAARHLVRVPAVRALGVAE